MADTFTTNLNLTKPEPGAAEDTWGISLNSDLDTLDAIFSSSGTQVNLNPNQVNFADNKKAIFGTGSDLEIYHDSATGQSVISESGGGDLLIKGSNLRLQSPTGENYFVAINNGASYVFHDGLAKLATTTSGIDVTGIATMDGLAVGTTSDAYSQVLINSSTTGESELRMGDTDTDAGSIAYTNSNDTMTFRAAAGARMSLNSTGIDVTGTVTSDGLTVDGDARVNDSEFLIADNNTSNTAKISMDIDTTNGARIRSSINGTATIQPLGFYTGSTKRLNITSGGDISFYDDTGTTQALFWDASAESLGIGTTSPDTMLHLSDTLGNAVIRLERNDTGIVNGDQYGAIEFEGQDANTDASGVRASIRAKATASLGQTALTFSTASNTATESERMRIAPDGSVGIGTASPSTKLQVFTDTGRDFKVDQSVANRTILSNSYRMVVKAGSGYDLDLDTGSANGNITFQNNGSEVARFDNNGRLGIGTTSPDRLLDVVGTDTIIAKFENTTATANGRIYLTAGSQTASIEQYGQSHASLPNVTQFSVPSETRFLCGGSTIATMKSSGNVGIGTDSPSEKLTVDGDGAFKNTTDATGATLKVADNVNRAITITSPIAAGAAAGRIAVTGTSNSLEIGVRDYPTALKIEGGSGNALFSSGVTVSKTSSGNILQVASLVNPVGVANTGVRLWMSGKNTTDRGTFIDAVAESTSNNHSLRFGTSASASAPVEAMRIDSSGNLLVGTTDDSPFDNSSNTSADNGIALRNDGILAVAAWKSTANVGNVVTANRTGTDGSILGFQKSGVTVGQINVAGGDISIGTGDVGLQFWDGGDAIYAWNSSANSGRDAAVDLGYSGARFKDLYLSGGLRGDTTFKNNAGTTEYARFDSSGELLAGKTSADNTTAGHRLNPSGFVSHVRSGNEVMILNRLSNDGSILTFRKDGANVGTIGSSATGTRTYIGNSASGRTAGLSFVGSIGIYPYDSFSEANTDNTLDLGVSFARFQDIYATNGTIQTSDINEKQDIEDLSEAETRVAVAAKGLLKKYRWKSAVADKGDDARIHFGIMAQDLENAFANEGLDAGDYGMFISSTWTDEATGEEKTRLGVRYNELLAFIIAAI